MKMTTTTEKPLKDYSIDIIAPTVESVFCGFCSNLQRPKSLGGRDNKNEGVLPGKDSIGGRSQNAALHPSYFSNSRRCVLLEQSKNRGALLESAISFYTRPEQVALAILTDYYSGIDVAKRPLPWTSATIAARYYQAFKAEFIAPAPPEGFEIEGEQIDKFINQCIRRESE